MLPRQSFDVCLYLCNSGGQEKICHSTPQGQGKCVVSYTLTEKVSGSVQMRVPLALPRGIF